MGTAVFTVMEIIGTVAFAISGYGNSDQCGL